MRLLLSHNQLEEIFLSVYLLACDQSSRNARHQRIFCFVLNYVPADSGSRYRQRYASVTMPLVGMCCLWCLCCKRSDVWFELNFRKLDVEMSLLVDISVGGCHLHEPKQQFWSAVSIFPQPSHATEIFIKVLVGLPCLIYSWSGLSMFKSSWPCGGVLQLVWHDSVSTVAFKFQSLSHFQVWCSRVGTQSYLTPFQKF